MVYSPRYSENIVAVGERTVGYDQISTWLAFCYEGSVTLPIAVYR